MMEGEADWRDLGIVSFLLAWRWAFARVWVMMRMVQTSWQLGISGVGLVYVVYLGFMVVLDTAIMRRGF